MAKKFDLTTEENYNENNDSFTTPSSNLYNNNGIDPDLGITTNSASEYLTETEIKDPNSIIVEISTPTPIIVLFGARESGKTMALVRLTRFLRKNGYEVEPARDFRPGNDKFYKRMCDMFTTNVYSDTAAASTNSLSFMLVNISKNGDRVCQVLEAPGEHYFDEEKNIDFPTYIHSIINNQLSKTWVFILENGWKNMSIRNLYANKVAQIFDLIDRNDNIILLCHKADKHRSYFYKGKADKSKFYRDIKEQYPAIFSKTGGGNNPFRNIFRPSNYDYDFVVFSAGSFTPRHDGGQTYIEGSDSYPADLWEAIQKSFKGSWL